MEMNNKKVVNMDVKQYGMFFALIAIYIVFMFLTNFANTKPVNINNLIMQNGYVVILAIGASHGFVIVTITVSHCSAKV